MHDENSFITLTYSDDQLPPDGGLAVRDFQNFMKRLRKAIAPRKVRYYACGEYGDQTLRPHYHAVVFGYDFPDRVAWRQTKQGHLVYRSAELERLWPFGLCELGSVTRQSGGYVARYVLKKITGSPAEEYYRRPHPVTGELFEVHPEFALMSSRPGIGGKWFDRYEGDAFPSDFLVLNGDRLPVPTYFVNRVKGRNLDESRLTVVDDFSPVRASRKEFASDPRNAENSTPERLAVREELAEHTMKVLKRDLG